ncbi:transcriptional regulator Spx ['Fragaria x ananassa' phyllody phytoplasma]|uniref:Transcriptional regulator Spx n=1 Tax='Fragaria x ananassa' phyllody phytoplasma TaxID=2358428 RepID=A0ABS5K2X7_9MOLU|nr:transcriptional regulator Spx ['Fragaria x ananassa' phyllody phytoplasma]MBS2126250.1 transcriptional regulator Spx ['Fragaria x ananassa' phyllody phytoplasma]
MVIVYTSFSCTSCQKAKKWLKIHGIIFQERNVFSYKFQLKDLDSILKNCDYGFDDIISKRSNFFKVTKIDLQNLHTVDMKQIIMANPGVLKRPILIEGGKIQIGYNEEGIRIFIPKKLREYLIQNNVNFYKENSQYEVLLRNFFKNNKLS